MRVLMVDPGALTPAYDDALCRALAGQGCEVELATSPFVYDELPPAEGYNRTLRFATFLTAARLPWRRLRAARRALKAIAYPLDWRALTRHVATWRPDVVHLQWSLDPRFDATRLRALRRRGVAVVLTAHNAAPHAGEPGRRGGRRALLAAADHVITLSEAVGAALATRYRLPAERRSVIPAGAAPENAVDRDAARARLGLDPHAPLVTMVGLLKPYKGAGLLLEAFARVQRSLPTARLVVAGDVRVGRAERARWEMLAQDAGARLDPRFLPEAELRDHLAAADVVALPYLTASQSAVLDRAQACGRAVVATRVGGLGEQLVEGEEGLLVPPGDAPRLAAALVALLGDRERCAAMGARARHRRERSWERAGAATLSLYRRLAAAPASAASEAASW